MLPSMRTTVTLEPATQRLLSEALGSHGLSCKEALNRAVVRGIAEPEQAAETLRAPPIGAMGLRAGHDAAVMNRLPDELEAQAFREPTTRLQNAAR